LTHQVSRGEKMGKIIDGVRVVCEKRGQKTGQDGMASDLKESIEKTKSERYDEPLATKRRAKREDKSRGWAQRKENTRCWPIIYDKGLERGEKVATIVWCWGGTVLGLEIKRDQKLKKERERFRQGGPGRRRVFFRTIPVGNLADEKDTHRVPTRGESKPQKRNPQAGKRENVSTDEQKRRHAALCGSWCPGEKGGCDQHPESSEITGKGKRRAACILVRTIKEKK